MEKRGRPPGGKKMGGRQKGTFNGKTIERMNRAKYILELIEDKYLDKDIKTLTANQRVQFYAEMMEYMAPKLIRTTLVGDPEAPLTTANTDNLTYEQLYKLKYGTAPPPDEEDNNEGSQE